MMVSLDRIQSQHLVFDGHQRFSSFLNFASETFKTREVCNITFERMVKVEICYQAHKQSLTT